jgi:hypothetical protein
VHVGVYSGTGEQIIGGAERDAADFYLYDIELRMMAGALERVQTFGVVDLAMQLTAMGLMPEGQTLDPNVVRQALLTAAEQARQAPNDHASLTMLLVRQLGLTQAAPYDLFTGVSLDTMRFDALSYFLLLAQASIPMIENQLPLPAGTTSNLVAQANGILKAEVPDPCSPSGFLGEAAKHSYGWLKNLADLLSLIPEGVAKASGIVDAIHGAMLAFSVSVTTAQERVETHYGPSGHESGAGEPLTFTVTVTMRDALPQTLIECGWILGTDFPAQGPIAGVSVHWFWDTLEEHGQISCGIGCLQTPGNGLSFEATNAQGVATMTFQPKAEENPDEGMIVEEHGMVTGVALYQSAFGNLLGAYAQYLTPKSAATRWVVKYHEVPGWDITMKVKYDIGSLHGDDPFWRWAKGEDTITVHIDAEDLFTQGHVLVEYSGSGAGTYGNKETPPTSCSWSGAWHRSNIVELLDRDQRIVDFMTGGVSYVPTTSDTNHPLSDDCNVAADIGIVPLVYPPAFSLNTTETQAFEVTPASFVYDHGEISGTITWEITVTPTGEP